MKIEDKSRLRSQLINQLHDFGCALDSTVVESNQYQEIWDDLDLDWGELEPIDEQTPAERDLGKLTSLLSVNFAKERFRVAFELRMKILATRKATLTNDGTADAGFLFSRKESKAKKVMVCVVIFLVGVAILKMCSTTPSEDEDKVILRNNGELRKAIQNATKLVQEACKAVKAM